MRKKSMAMSTIGYMLVAITLLLVLTFIYFGHTGFFQKIYKITDKLGLTNLAKAVQEKEEDITEGRLKLSPEELAAEEQVKSAMAAMMSDIELCLKGQECVCTVNMPLFPEGYAMRFVNSGDKVHVSAFRFMERSWRGDFDMNFQEETGVHFVLGATHKLEKTQACLVIDLEEHLFDGDSIVDDIQLRRPTSGMIQLYWEKNELRATEAVSSNWLFNRERSYEIYGNGKAPNAIYKTDDGRFCFFAERFVDDDSNLVGNIKCGQSKEE